jgi:hypothetical protein
MYEIPVIEPAKRAAERREASATIDVSARLPPVVAGSRGSGARKRA